MSSFTRTIHQVLGGLLLSAFTMVLSSPAVAADAPLTGKLYTAEVTGTVTIKNNDKTASLGQKSLYDGAGSSISTGPDGVAALVLSNGIGMAMDGSTELEVKSFTQTAFAPNRTDLDKEPSTSQTSLFIGKGTVSLYTGDLAPTSTFKVESPVGSATIVGKEVVVEVTDNQMVISLLSGSATVEGQPLAAGQQAIITRDPVTGATKVTIRDLTDAEKAKLQPKVDVAAIAIKTVAFDVTGQNITAAQVINGLKSKTEVSPISF